MKIREIENSKSRLPYSVLGEDFFEGGLGGLHAHFGPTATTRNAFLVRGSIDSEEALAGLYPKGQQRETINATFTEYFSALGHALKAN